MSVDFVEVSPNMKRSTLASSSISSIPSYLEMSRIFAICAILCTALTSANVDPLANSLITPFGRVHASCIHHAPK